jgi:SPP1 gp7 family putative phage head morphogenesis protein
VEQVDQNQLDKHLDELIDQAELDIDKVFGKRLKALTSQLGDMFRKYSTNGALTYADLQKYSRFQKEMNYIAEQIHEDYKGLLPFIQSLMENQYLENYYKSAYLYEFEAQQKLGYALLNHTVIEAAVLNQIPQLTLPALMEYNRNETVRRISIEITQGLIAGEGYSDIARRIEKTVGFSATKAKRVARTEAGRCQSLGRLDSYKQASKYVKMEKVWSATLDRITRSSHQVLDDDKADAEGYFHFKGHKAEAPRLFGVAELDINCRCAFISTVNGKKPSVRRERLENGKTVIIPYLDYKSWAKDKGFPTFGK